MIDKKKFLYFNRITLVVIIIFLLLSVIKIAFSRFFTEGDGEAMNDIAFYIIDPGTQSQTLNLFDVKPDGKDYIYHLDISNYKDNQVSEVDLEYQLELTTTTNIPVEYKIYLNDSVINEFHNKEILQYEDGVYFFKFRTPNQQFQKNIKKTNHYQLVVNFPSSYNEEAYQDLIDSVEIVITATQM